ncbi:hypothetical protein HK100_006662 [Physocladia obscura]|uniref:RED-like N-terminal domain-containing protein n=1 Tax=Physocladia obscura TaxID=109957 RepID=A0AAD5TAD7_9FUNG|nr:hypothetical protein HK100_006662 [Physocladia obscura]
MSLSQEDFRRLLATPRPQTSIENFGARGNGKPVFAKPAAKIKQNDINSKPEFARPIPRHFHKKQLPQDPDESATVHFRDRARERRQGINPDYKDSDDILARLSATEQAEKNETDSAEIKSALYQQSKYLGGDLTHTHLVKGLDFALLKKVRSELKDSNQEEKETEAYLDRIENSTLSSSSTAIENSTTTSSATTFNSSLAEQICLVALSANKKSLTRTNELFQPGRMAFCWDLGDKNCAGGDPIPTMIIRSKGDIKEEKASTLDSEVVMGKIIEILGNVRFGAKSSEEGLTAGERKALKKKEREEKLQREAEVLKKQQQELGIINRIEMNDDGDDIFADAGRDYSLEATAANKNSSELFNDASKTVKAPVTSYFAKPVLDSDDEIETKIPDDLPKPHTKKNNESDDEDDDEMFADLDAVAGLKEKRRNSLAPRTKDLILEQTSDLDKLLISGAKMLNSLQGAGTAEKIIAETVKTAKKPPAGGLSLTRLTNNYGEEDAEFDQYYDSDDADDDEEAAADASQLDLGIKARKRTQMKRYDFETEEEFQAYKDSQVVMPKSAYQFGVKSGEGRKSRKELSGSSGGGGGKKGDDAKLDKEMKQLDKMMGEKYGVSITKNDKKRENPGGGGESNRGGGGGGARKRRM